MIVLGAILLILGFVLKIQILWTIGIILLVIGAVLWLLGAVGRPVGGTPLLVLTDRAGMTVAGRGQRGDRHRPQDVA